MKKNNTTSISKAGTIEEIAEFWDNHSLADFWDETHPVEFSVRAVKRCRVTTDPDLYSKIVNRSHIKGILPETLIHLWLYEKISESEVMV